jgi:hypothetical protein
MVMFFTDFVKILFAGIRNRGCCDHSYNTMQQITVGLIGERHTQFIALTCDKCGNKAGFPRDNLYLALKQGTDDTKEKLRQLGFINMCK